MLSAHDVSLQFGKRVLFDEVNISFKGDNCYGIIGANGAGKSTFLKILSGEIEPNQGSVSLESGKRMAVLKQDHNVYNEYTVLDTVMMGHSELWKIKEAKDAIYMKEDFNDEDGIKASELEEEFAEMNGWNAEADAGALLSGIGISEADHFTLVKELDSKDKVKILLAQALFGDPDILILDEPTNDLDFKTIQWLEDFLLDFKNTVIVVSHDRHFLDTVCTHIVDIDFGQIKLYSGNYSFWYESSQLAMKQRMSANKKAEDKRKELQAFIDRFSANASKSKQATARKKMLEKITVDEIQPSNRKYPGIIWRQEREVGKSILTLKEVSYVDDMGSSLFSNINLEVNKGDKIAILGNNSLAVSAFLDIIAGTKEPSTGTIEIGQTVTRSFLPVDHDHFFTSEENLMDWLRKFSENKDELFIRGFLGKMLFSGEEVMKKSSVLSGGEKVRCMLSKMMMAHGNLLILDEPTNHLDLETITALNNSLVDFKGNIIFTSHDHTFNETISNRIIELFPDGYIDSLKPFNEYLKDEGIQVQRENLQKAELV